MQKDFHYHIAYVLAKLAGYDQKQRAIIAYASQYVDDNTDRKYVVSDAYGEFFADFPDYVAADGKRFYPIITQVDGIDYSKLTTQKYVYAPFHFLPAGEEDSKNDVLIDGVRNPFCTIRGCDNAVELLASAIKSNDPYLLGIALHTYADTWAHEKFTAFQEDWNKNRKPLTAKRLGPEVGHAQFLHDPDEISKTWTDYRFGDDYKVNNTERALECIRASYKVLKPVGVWDDVKAGFEQIVQAPNAAYRMDVIKQTHPEIPFYDENLWINEALGFKRDLSEVPKPDPSGTSGETGTKNPRFVEVSFKGNFAESHWHKFQLAAKKQLASVLNMVRIL